MSIKGQIRFYSRILMVVIFVLGFNIGLTMVRPPEFLPRKPASIPGEPGQKIVNDFEVSALVELGCNSTDDKTISTKTSLVRLKGCLGDTGLPAEVVNKTTGFTASILDADGFFTTDYFQLNPGTNLISVTYVDQSGSAKIYEYRVRLQ